MSTSSNLARSWSAANFFFGMVMFLPTWLFAQSGAVSTSSFVLNSASLTSPVVLSFAVNPALLECSADNALLCHSTPSPFGLSELAFHECRCCLAIAPDLHTALGLSAYGSRLYSELNASLSFSTRLSSLISLGCTVRGSHVSVADFNAHTAGFLDCGVVLQPSADTRLGIAIQNCTRTSAAANADQEMRLGAAHAFADSLELDCDYCIALNRTAGVDLALAVHPLSAVDFRLACSTYASKVEADLGLLVIRPLRIVLRCGWHSDLGSSLGGGVVYTW